MTGFEPATTRPPDVDSTSRNADANVVKNFGMKQGVERKI